MTSRAVLLVVAFAAALSPAAAADFKVDDTPRIGAYFVDGEHLEKLLKERGEEAKVPRVGAIVARLMPGGPAGKAGLERFSAVVRIGDKKIESAEDATHALAALKAGEAVRVVAQVPRSINGRVRWSVKTYLIEPVTLADLFKSVCKSEHDEVDRVTHYRHPSSPKGIASSSSLTSYLSVLANGEPVLRWRINYAGRDWLFMKKLVVVADGARFEFDLSKNKRFSENNARTCWEWFDLPVDQESRKMLVAVATASDVTVRLVGDQYVKDFLPTFDELEGLELMLAGEHLAKSGSLK